MADYYDELGWTPIPVEETQRHQNLLIIRELLSSGLLRDDLAYELPPPASKELVRNLEERTPLPTDESCTICLRPNESAEEETRSTNNFKILPCGHEFHIACILPWLNRVCAGWMSAVLPIDRETTVFFSADQLVSLVPVRDGDR